MIKTFGDTFQDFIYFRTYSRWIEEKGRREFWNESVERYEKFFIQKVPKAKKKEFKTACKAILDIEVMSSMRALWTAGKALEREHICLYNCAYTPIDSIKSFSELLYILMCGTGVGYSVERQYVTKLPEITKLTKSEDIIVFADSKLGWAEGFNKFIRKLYAGTIPKYDLSKIRAKGMPLKTFGGRSSGPDVLENLLKFTISLFKNAEGRKLNSCECNDLCCFIASVVVVGGVRRSSCINLSNPSDDRMRHAKDGQFWNTNPYRALANNSTAYTEKPSSDAFLSEFLSLIRSGSGERGIFNRESCEFIVQQNEYRKSGYAWGCNPSLRKGTKIWTSEGIFPIDSLEDKKFLVRNFGENLSEAKCFLSGKNKQLYKVSLEGGHDFYATPEHEWPIWDFKTKTYEKVKTEALQEGSRLPLVQHTFISNGSKGTYSDGFAIGWNLGDGWITKRADNGNIQIGFMVSEDKKKAGILDILVPWLESNIDWTGSFDDKEEINVNNKKLVEIFNKFGVKDKSEGLPSSVWSGGSELFIKGVVDGLFSSDASISDDGIYFHTSKKQMAEDVSELLGFYGIKNTILYSERNISFPNGKDYGREYGMYVVKIKQQLSVKHFANVFNLTHKQKQIKLANSIKNKKSHLNEQVKIKSVILTDIFEDVWDISVKDETHSFQLSNCVTGNCSERILRPKGLCNLSEVIVRPDDDKDTLCRKVRQATILGCVQAAYTDFNFISREWKKNAEEERLIGVSLTGIRDHHTLNRVTKEAKLWLTEMKQVCIDTAKEWSDALEINMPACQTCIKPSGSVSALVGTASGLHARYAQYYMRRVRVAAIDPLAQLLIDTGVPHTPENGQTEANVDTWVFEFPMKSAENSILQEEVGAIDQLEYWLMLQKYWCSGKPSCTIHVADDEWVDVAAWVYKHWNYMSGVAFLPKSNTVYEKMPFEEVSESEYNDMVANFPVVDFSKLSEYEISDRTIGASELACSSGSCEIE